MIIYKTINFDYSIVKKKLLKLSIKEYCILPICNNSLYNTHTYTQKKDQRSISFYFYICFVAWNRKTKNICVFKFWYQLIEIRITFEIWVQNFSVSRYRFRYFYFYFLLFVQELKKRLDLWKNSASYILEGWSIRFVCFWKMSVRESLHLFVGYTNFAGILTHELMCRMGLNFICKFILVWSGADKFLDKIAQEGRKSIICSIYLMFIYPIYVRIIWNSYSSDIL